MYWPSLGSKLEVLLKVWRARVVFSKLHASINFLFFKFQVCLPKAKHTETLKIKRGLLMSNHRYDDTFGPERLQILQYERKFPMLGDLL